MATTRGEQLQSTDLKEVHGLHHYRLPVPDPLAGRQHLYHLSNSSKLELIYELFPISF